MFWGLVVFMPVGVTYLSAILLLLTMLVAGGLDKRYARLRANPLWWPVMAYLAWTFIVLAIGQHYPETGSNLFHGIRIGLTPWCSGGSRAHRRHLVCRSGSHPSG